MDGHVLMNLRLRARCLPIAAATTLLLGVGFALGGCGSTDCSFTATCGGGTAIIDGGGDGPIIPMDCNLSLDPKDSMGCLVDSVGVFVSAKGRGGATGTMKDPLPTIADGIALAASTNRPRVYICEGTYPEAIKIASPVSVYGGLTCADNVWVAKDDVKPKVTPAVGPAIDVRSVMQNVVVQNIDALGMAPSGVGGSAIGAFIIHSRASLRGVLLAAGPGQNGQKGTSRSNYSAPALPGKDATGTGMGGEGGSCTCTDSTTSKGGRGADGDGSKFSNGSSVPPIGDPNFGASGFNPGTCMLGRPGADGEAGGGSEPVDAPGKATEVGWEIGKRALTGPNGRPAQGGGGGGADTQFGAAGSGGGCGGCGGAGGESGSNGGASIGVFAFDSEVTIDASQISTAPGGKGGAGGDGQPGQSGAGPGASGACAGGNGGAGAGGSAGTGGTGGDSIAIVWKERLEPIVTKSDLKPGTGGGFGDPGAIGLGAGNQGGVGKAGIAGRSLKVFASQ